MQLTDEEKRMLNGEQGKLIQKMMGLLVAMGEAFDATRMVPVHSSHITSVSSATLRRGGRQLVAEIANSGACVKVLTTTNPTSTDYARWQELGISRELLDEQFMVDEDVCRIGITLSHNCATYMTGNSPHFGQHIAWGEAHAVVYVNSVLGARTNAEGAPSALAAALTGRIPYWGLHLDENRLGKIQVRVTAKMNEVADYGLLGHWTGGACQENTPVFTGIPASVTPWSDLKMLSGGMALLTPPAIFHAVGVTPEARTEEQAFGGKKPLDVVEFGEKEKKATIEYLSKAKTKDVNWVAVGCPFFSVSEFRELAGLMDGKKLNSNVSMWVCTSRPMKVFADRMGYTEVIEKTGAKVVCDTCPVVSTKEAIENLGFHSVTTNSAVMADYVPTIHRIPARVGTLAQCVDAAVSGTWR
ncbi:aconitase X [Chloroflexota bacterium]